MNNDLQDLQNERQWWLQQWLDLINSYRFKKRLERGWKYAREGKVLSIEFEGQMVKARVQGTEPEPYQVSLWMDTFSDEDWEYVVKNMAEQAIFSAQLLAGEMPKNIEDVFTAAGLRLFPFSLSDIKSRCSCPDKANPCKHISAVYYLLGDRFSEDPFVLFQLRGRSKEQIIAELRKLRSSEVEENSNNEREEKENHYQINKYPLEIAHFWEYKQQLEPSLVVIAPPASSETVLDILGTIPVEPSTTAQAVMKYWNAVYKNISQEAVLTALNREEC